MNDHQKPCPHCGYCPTCGRSNAAPYRPYPWTWVPHNPYPTTVTIGTPSAPATVWYGGAASTAANPGGFTITST